MKELTIELTDYCPHHCSYCSSEAKARRDDATFMTFTAFSQALGAPGTRWSVIHLSGGEPLAHPEFWEMLGWSKRAADRVVVHTNALTDIAFNPNVIDGVRVEAYLTVPDTTDQVHILKRVRQGREAKRPEVTWSRNYTENCAAGCGHTVIRPNGTVAPAPCAKGAPDA